MNSYSFYIVDDDDAVIKNIKYIIEENDLGQVSGCSTSSSQSLNEITFLRPDIVIVDYLMPEIDGINLINKLISNNSDSIFIMLSKVSDKEMIAEAYKTGIEFFINKPINIIEMKYVINKVIEKLNIQKKLNAIQNIFDDRPILKKSYNKNKKQLNFIKIILGRIGIYGNKGYNDILKICQYIINNNIYYNDLDLKSISIKLGIDYKISMQRIRRAASLGLRNIANLGIEDYMNEYFVEYSNPIFGFENVKMEMDHIRNKKSCGGKVNVKSFLIGLLIVSEKILSYQ